LALGIWRHQANANGRHATLNPPRDGYLDLAPEDRLIVLCKA